MFKFKRREANVCYSSSSTGFDHTCSQPPAVIFILRFVIYRSGRKLNTTAQSQRKWVSDHPLQLILALIQPGKKERTSNAFIPKTVT